MVTRAIEWWLKNDKLQKACDVPNCARRTQTTGGGYYQKPVSYVLTNNVCSSNCLPVIKEKLQKGYGVALHLQGSIGHFISAWGYEQDASGKFTHIYITDSDDQTSALKKFPLVTKKIRNVNYYYLSGYSIWGYKNFRIDRVYGLKPRTGTITPQYTIKVVKSGNGTGTVTGTGINCGTDCTATYRSGTVLDLKPIPAQGSVFSGWQFNGVPFTGNKKVTSNGTVTAVFEQWNAHYPIENDPHQTGCDQTAITLGEPQPIKSSWNMVIGYTEVRYSTACNTVWARTISHIGETTIKAAIVDCADNIPYEDTWDSWGTVTWSPMMKYLPNYTYKANGKIRTNTAPYSTIQNATTCISREGDGLQVPIIASLRSYNYREYFMAHQSGLGEIITITSESDRQDSTFKIVPGLAGPKYISFESVNHPGFYLRHQDARIKLHQYANDDLFKKDATFKIVKGLADNTWMSFESVNYPGYYIRHDYGHLYISKGSDSLFRKDVTFKIDAPNWTPPTPTYPVKDGQVWTGNYTCSQGATALNLRIVETAETSLNTLQVKAIFDFNYADGSATGAFYLNGQYTASSRTLRFEPGAWINQPSGYSAVGMTGTISSTGTRYQGQIASSNCGAFDLTLMSKPAPVNQPIISGVSPNPMKVATAYGERQWIKIYGNNFGQDSILDFQMIGGQNYTGRIPQYITPTELRYFISIGMNPSDWTVKVRSGGKTSNTYSFKVTR